MNMIEHNQLICYGYCLLGNQIGTGFAAGGGQVEVVRYDTAFLG
jgi:hypothetical protein